MKTCIASLLFALALALPLFGQQSKFLLGEEPTDEVRQHLEAVKMKLADTAFIYSAIPVASPFVGDERNAAPQHFPYPVIFIHGLVGSSDTWAEFYEYALNQGWTCGGQLAFNLNADGDFGYSNIFSTASTDFVDFCGGVPAADFYLMNFNTGVDGTCYGSNHNTSTQSNQAAIAKQGLAVRNAIGHVMQATGKDKVILFGHSMGGLAARQYLQTPSLWQPDGEHHVAKLITSGTPHGGSNATTTFLGDAFLDIDERSDAIRDLRRSYFYSFDDGVFLYGGQESSSVLFDNLAGFYDLDVNCNGGEGNQITGLNEKDIYTDLDYSCIIGDWFYDISIDDPGDGVVEVEDAQLKNFYGIISETFIYENDEWNPSGEHTLHTALPGYNNLNFLGLDEPDYYDLSYQIEPNADYNGFVSLQASDAEYDIDYDDFVFTLNQPGSVSVTASNIPSNSFGVSVLSHPNFGYLFDQEYASSSVQTQSIQLPAGTYYLEFYAQGDLESWEYPYAFRLNFNPDNPSASVEATTEIEVKTAPNPVSNTLYVTIENHESISGSIKLQNQLGQVVGEKRFEGSSIDEQFDMSGLPEGTYFLTVGTGNGSKTGKIVKIR